MDAQTIHLSADAGFQSILSHNILIHRGGIERAVEFAGAVVRHRTKHGAGGIGNVAGERQVFLDQPLRQDLDGYEPDLAALALDPKMQHSLTALHVLYAQSAELLAADAVVEQGGENGTIANTLEGIGRRRVEQLAGLSVAERRRARWSLRKSAMVRKFGALPAASTRNPTSSIKRRSMRRELNIPTQYPYTSTFVIIRGS
jgi:hypothetical protein